MSDADKKLALNLQRAVALMQRGLKTYEGQEFDAVNAVYLEARDVLAGLMPQIEEDTETDDGKD